MSLSIEELEEKIKRVNEDLSLLASTGDASRKMEVLNEYKEYLTDELKSARQQKTS